MRDIVLKKSLEYLERLTDDTGLIQHAHFSVPDPQHGYALDDNARGLIVSIQHHHTRLTSIYLSFIRHAQTKEGKFHNFLNYRREWVDEGLLNDSFGRAFWALGYCKSQSIVSSHRESAEWMLNTSKKYLFELENIRTIAFCLMGLYFSNEEEKGLINYLGKKLLHSYRKNSSPEWKWFEDKLTYENARLPQALLYGFKATKDQEYLKVALESLDFLIKVQFDSKKKVFSFIGQNGWYEKGKRKASFDQQTVEPGGMTETLVLAYQLSSKKEYLDLAFKSLAWFEGGNIKGVSMKDAQTGGIFDGLTKKGPNKNEGAESIVSFLLAYESLDKGKSQKY